MRSWRVFYAALQFLCTSSFAPLSWSLNATSLLTSLLGTSHSNHIVRVNSKVQNQPINVSSITLGTLSISAKSKLHLNVTEREQVLKKACFQRINALQSIPVFWVNREDAAARRYYFSSQMRHMGMKHKRIRAVTPNDPRVMEVQLKVEPRVEHTPKERSCVLSHLLAVYTAVHDRHIDPGNPYALIAEDDISFEMDVDFRALVDSAPKDFGVLQLMTSNANEVKIMWNGFKKAYHKSAVSNGTNLWHPRSHSSHLWSAQAYIIKKSAFKAFINKAFRVENGTFSVQLINPSPKSFPCSGKSCYFPYRIVSEIYLFAAGEPAYTCKIPLFNGSNTVGQTTSIHGRKNNEESHSKNFREIAQVIEEVKSNIGIIPRFIRKKSQCELISLEKHVDHELKAHR